MRLLIKSKTQSRPRPISIAKLHVLTTLPHATYPPGVLPGVLPNIAVDGRIHLGVGFALRCFQRLSAPDVATRRLHLAA